MSNIKALEEKAKECLEKKADVPMSPLWHMGKAAKSNSAKNLKVLQDAVDYLTCKARAKIEFSKRDKEFLKEIYEAFWWGGHKNGYREAAKVANHYVNGDGKTIQISSSVYENSKIVQLTIDAMKQFIKDQSDKQMSITTIKSTNVQFLQKPYAIKLKNMDQHMNGQLKSTGVLLTEQSNARLKYTDHRFVLHSSSIKVPQSGIKTRWHVDSTYDFKSFESADDTTELPLGEGHLYLPDGLSEYMTQIDIAVAFNHQASWSEVWS